MGKSLLGTDNFIHDHDLRLQLIAKLEEIKQSRQDIIDKTTQYNVNQKIAREVVLKRSPYDYLLDNELLDIDLLILERSKMMQKKCKLPPGVRMFIYILFSTSMDRTLAIHALEIQKKLKTKSS